MCVGVSVGFVCEREERKEVGSAASESLGNKTFV